MVKNSKQNPLGQLLAVVGFLPLFLFGALIPIFVWPARLFPEFDTIQSETIFMKRFLLIALAGVTLGVGALWLLFQPRLALAKEARMPAILLLLWLLWGAASIHLNAAVDGLGNTWPFWNHWIMVLLPGFAALFGLFFLQHRRAVEFAIGGLLTAAVVVAGIGVASWLGWRGFHEYVFGKDPRTVLEDPALAEFVPLVQGGSRSSFAMSTLANPEYAGTYMAVMIAMMAVVLLDWARIRRWALGYRIALLALFGMMVMHLVFTTSRMGIIAVGLLALFRIALAAEVRTRWVVLAFCVFVWALMLGGVLAAAGVLILAGLSLLLLLIRKRGISGLIGMEDRLGRAFVLTAPVVAVLLMIAYSVPGPWNPSGLRLAQRFTSLIVKSDNSLDERALMFVVASNMARNNPVFGVGPGRYQTLYYETVSSIDQSDDSGVMHRYRILQGNLFGAQAHSDLLQIAAETGLVGLLLFVLFVLTTADRLLSVVRRDPKGYGLPGLVILLGLLGFVAIMMSSFPLQMPSRAAAFWCVVACAFGIINGACKDSLRPDAP